MGTIVHDFDAPAGYNSGTGVNELYTPALGQNGPTGWRYLGSDTTRAITYPFRAVGYVSGNITVAIDWYAETLTAGTVTWEVSLSAQNPTGSAESAEAPANATVVSGSGTISSTAKASVRTTITIPQASADGLSADWLAYLRVVRNDATADATINHRVSVSYSDSLNSVNGPVNSVTGNIATWSGTAGSALSDSGILASAVAISTETPGSSVNGEIVVFADTGGRNVVGSGTTLASVVRNSGPSVTDGNVTKFFGTSGLDIRDAGYAATAVVNVTSPLSGDIPQWNGSSWVPKYKKTVVISAFTVTSTTLADVTGMTFTLPRAGSYRFVVNGAISTVTTAQALQFAVNYTGTVTGVGASGVWTTPASGYFAWIVQTANNAVASATTAGTAAANATQMMNFGGGIIVSTASGTLSFRMLRPTASGTTTLLAGASMEVSEV